MKQTRIYPDEMAEIYFNRLRFRAISEVKILLKNYESDTGSTLYWEAVLRSLTKRGGKEWNTFGRQE